MPLKRRKPAPTRRDADSAAAVDDLLTAMSHPHVREIQALRTIIRGVDPRVVEGVKWNAPSFATAEHFATFHLRSKSGVQVVLHLGAKARSDVALRDHILDRDGLLEWRDPNRATVTFANLADVEAKRGAFVGILRQWIAFVR